MKKLIFIGLLLIGFVVSANAADQVNQHVDCTILRVADMVFNIVETHVNFVILPDGTGIQVATVQSEVSYENTGTITVYCSGYSLGSTQPHWDTLLECGAIAFSSEGIGGWENGVVTISFNEFTYSCGYRLSDGPCCILQSIPSC